MTASEFPLADIASIQMGYQARAGIVEDLDAEYLILRAPDVSSTGEMDFAGSMRFSPDINPAPYLVSPGEILMVARGQNHLAHLVQEPPAKAVASNSFYILRLADGTGTLPHYLAWWLNSPDAQAYFQQNQARSTIPFLSKKALGACVVPIPPLEVQERIGNLVLLARRERMLINRIMEQRETLVQEVCRKAATI